jgi:Flp pilus assembly protein TadG
MSAGVSANGRGSACGHGCAGGRPSGRRGADGGQASIELIGGLPLLMVLILATAEVLAAGGARSAASGGAEAGAMAVLQGGDPEAAARAAAPSWAHARLAVRVEGRRVTVRATPPALLPWLPALLSSTATASAGPGS